jgi:O-antigen/teichoic acid export membrane protein
MKSLKIASISNVAQILFSSIIFFVLYKLLLKDLGSEIFGIFALVTSFTSLARAFDFGITTGITKFVADYYKDKRHKEINKLIESSIIYLMSVTAIICILIYISYTYFADIFLDLFSLGVVNEIIVYALIFIWLSMLAFHIQNILDGFGLIVKKNILLLITNLIYICLTVTLVPKFGLLGLIASQIIQALFFIFTGVFYIKKLVRFKLVPTQINITQFKKIFHFGIEQQAGNTLVYLIEPISKAFIFKFLGPSSLGLFEIAYQFTNRIRSLVVNSNQLLITIVSSYKKNIKQKIKETYKKNSAFLIMLCIPMFTAIIFFRDIISYYLIGSIDYNFITYLTGFSIAYLLNTINSPIYFINIATGKLRFNNIPIVFIFFSLFIFFVLIYKFKTFQLIFLAYFMAIILGNFLSIYIFIKRYEILKSWYFNKNNSYLYCGCIAALILSLLLPNKIDLNYFTFAAVFLGFAISFLIFKGYFKSVLAMSAIK